MTFDETETGCRQPSPGPADEQARKTWKRPHVIEAEVKDGTHHAGGDGADGGGTGTSATS